MSTPCRMTVAKGWPGRAQADQNVGCALLMELIYSNRNIISILLSNVSVINILAELAMMIMCSFKVHL